MAMLVAREQLARGPHSVVVLIIRAPVPLSPMGVGNSRQHQSFAFSSGFGGGGMSRMARWIRVSRAYTSGLTLPICEEFCWTLWLLGQTGYAPPD